MRGVGLSQEVLAYASYRGVAVVKGVAEALPFSNQAFDYALCVTTICFVEDAIAMLSEAYRVLKPGGALVVGFIDRTSSLGRHYLAHQAENVFYREATFFSAVEVEHLLFEAGFTEPSWVQTLSKPLKDIREIEAIRASYGQGTFVVVKANRS